MLELISHDDVVEIHLARPPVNALNQELLQALRRAVADATGQGARGLVISGGLGTFSAGVDVPALMTLDRDGVRAFWWDFFHTCSALATCPVPVVASIGGHSPAGGAVLSLFCDYRVMAEGPYRIGLNEVQVGLDVPEPIQLALRRLVGRYRAERLLVSGSLLEAGEALRVGVVDELTGIDQVTTRALHWLNQLLALPPQAMLKTRAVARADLMQAWGDPDSFPVDSFVDAFFGEETQTVLQALVARLKKNR